MSNTDNIISFKGYHGIVDYSASDKCLHGKILGITDLVTFEGDTDSIEEAFRESVDDYLDFCKRHGKEPDKECSGNFNIRINPSTHYALVVDAQKQNISLNGLVNKIFTEHTDPKKSKSSVTNYYVSQIYRQQDAIFQSMPNIISTQKGETVWKTTN